MKRHHSENFGERKDIKKGHAKKHRKNRSHTLSQSECNDSNVTDKENRCNAKLSNKSHRQTGDKLFTKDINERLKRIANTTFIDEGKSNSLHGKPSRYREVIGNLYEPPSLQDLDFFPSNSGSYRDASNADCSSSVHSESLIPDVESDDWKENTGDECSFKPCHDTRNIQVTNEYINWDPMATSFVQDTEECWPHVYSNQQMHHLNGIRLRHRKKDRNEHYKTSQQRSYLLEITIDNQRRKDLFYREPRNFMYDPRRRKRVLEEELNANLPEKRTHPSSYKQSFGTDGVFNYQNNESFPGIEEGHFGKRSNHIHFGDEYEPFSQDQQHFQSDELEEFNIYLSRKPAHKTFFSSEQSRQPLLENPTFHSEYHPETEENEVNKVDLEAALGQLDTLQKQPGYLAAHDRYSIPDLKKLYKKAKKFVSHNHRLYWCEYFYRDATKDYYNDIKNNYQGIMSQNIKDLHGDPRSPINGNLQGLFFSVRVDRNTYELPNYSMFGERRMMIPVGQLINCASNIYFTDFYCTNRCHYITLVITNPGSAADQFCRENLLKIDKRNNCFLQFSYSEETGSCSVCVPWQPIVEVFYTEDIDVGNEVQAGAVFTYVNMVGQRLGGKIGLVKNTSCKVCNM